MAQRTLVQMDNHPSGSPWEMVAIWITVDECFKVSYHRYMRLNRLRPRQNGRHFADDFLKCIFVNENVWIAIEISLKFVCKGPIDNIPSMVYIMAWCRPGNKPLSGPMVVRLPTHICFTWPQWVKQPRHCWGQTILLHLQGPLSLTWINFDLSMDK